MNTLFSCIRSSGLLFAICTLAILFHAYISNPAWGAEPVKEKFLSDVRTALSQKDLKAFIRLFNWERVNEKVRATLDKYLFSRLLEKEISNVSFVALPEDFRSEYVLNGVRNYPNLRILGFVQIKYKKGKHGKSSTKIPYGKKGGQYMFVGTIQKKIRDNAPKSKQIQVIIIGMGHPPVKFEGYMLYLQNEQPIREQLMDMGGGNLTRIVRGEDITYLKVQRTSKKGTLRVIIIIDDKTIFETQSMDTGQPIIFKR